MHFFLRLLQALLLSSVFLYICSCLCAATGSFVTKTSDVTMEVNSEKNGTSSDSGEGSFRGVTNFLIVTMPIMVVMFFLTCYISLRCPWFSGGPSAYTRLRRVGLSPVQGRRRGGAFHPLYIPRRPFRPTRLEAQPKKTVKPLEEY